MDIFGTITITSETEEIYGVRPGKYLVLANNEHSMMNAQTVLVEYQENVTFRRGQSIVTHDSPVLREEQTMYRFTLDYIRCMCIYHESFPDDSCGNCAWWTPNAWRERRIKPIIVEDDEQFIIRSHMTPVEEEPPLENMFDFAQE